MPRDTSSRDRQPLPAGYREAVRQVSWASSDNARATMRANRSRDTLPELALRRALHARGLRYFVNRRPLPGLRRTADIVFPTARVAVFVDGCFWHGCPEHHTSAKANATFWADKVSDNRARDADTNAALTAAGWTPLRIWEHTPVEEAIAQVIAAVRGDASDRVSPPDGTRSRPDRPAPPPPRTGRRGPAPRAR